MTRFVFYCGVLLAAVTSVMLGLDWMPAPMPPMPETKNLVFVAPPPPPAPPPAVVTQPAQPVPAVAPSPVEPPAPAPPPQIAVEPAPPKCDVRACASAYRSFTESDCTYQPSEGPRRLCTKGVSPTEASGVATPSSAAADMPSNVKCNVTACAAAYGSFTASDCTYQPFNGPRRLCEK